MCGSRTARRVSGLTRHGNDVRVGPVQPVEQLAAVGRRAERQHRAAVAIPRANERFADALAATLGRDHRVAAPRAFDFDPLDRHADRQRRVVADDRRAFARDPDLRLPGLVVRIASMLPVPAKPERVGGVGAVRASIKRIDAATVVRLEAIDFRHRRINPAGRNAAGPCGERLLALA